MVGIVYNKEMSGGWIRIVLKSGKETTPENNPTDEIRTNYKNQLLEAVRKLSKSEIPDLTGYNEAFNKLLEEIPDEPTKMRMGIEKDKINLCIERYKDDNKYCPGCYTIHHKDNFIGLRGKPTLKCYKCSLRASKVAQNAKIKRKNAN